MPPLAQKRQVSANQRKPTTQRTLSNAGRNIASQGSQRSLERQKSERNPPGQPRNFVRDNKVASAEQNSRLKQAPKSVDAEKRKNYGKVPSYLLKQKEQREEAKRQRELEAEQEKCPPGTRLLPEEERLQTLADLRLAIRDAQDQLNKMPIS